MTININDQVRVKLSDRGKQALQDYDEAMRLTARLQADKDGYHSFQFWELMYVFGSITHLGRQSPFDSEIEVVPF